LITERGFLELIPVLGSQPAGDVSHKPGGRLLLLSASPAVTLTALQRTAINFSAEITELHILRSELSRCKLSPTLASIHYCCPDSVIELVGRQLGRNFLITTNVYVDQTICTIFLN